jgi:hypothetical protein
MPVAPLALSDPQLQQIFATAAALPVDQRGLFLRTFASLLGSTPTGDGQVFRACKEAARAARYDSIHVEAV